MDWFIEDVKKDVENLLEGKSEYERIRILKELASYRSDYQNAPDLMEKIKRARSYVAKQMLQEISINSSENISRIEEKIDKIERKVDLILQVLEELKNQSFREYESEIRRREERKEYQKSDEEKTKNLSESARKVYEFIKQNNGATFSQIMNYLDMSRQDVYRATAELFENQLIRKDREYYRPR